MSSTLETVSPLSARHWSAKYIGTPYQAGARGPTFYDCWGIIQLIYRQERGIILPTLPGLCESDLQGIHEAVARESQGDWTAVDKPVDGVVVAMSNRNIIHHVGLWIDCDGGKVFHSKPGHNAVAETIRSLRLRGLRVVKFYQHKSWSTSSSH